MKLEIGETYTSYEIGSRARVIDITDNILTYEIVYHPHNPEILGCRGKMEKQNFASRTERFNASYRDHKLKLEI